MNVNIECEDEYENDEPNDYENKKAVGCFFNIVRWRNW